MIKVIPSIPTNNPTKLFDLLEIAEKVVDRVSIDIVDGQFADNKTVDPNVLAGFETTLSIGYQLMVKEPINWIERCVQGQADRIIGHIEQMSDQVEFVGRVQEVGAKVGLGLDLATPVSDLDVTILNDLDTVLVMSVPAGFGGQKFDKSALEKIRELDEIRSRDKSPYVIHGDGGITFDNIGDVRRAGADEVSIGVRIFEGDLEENVKAYIKEAYKKNR